MNVKNNIKLFKALATIFFTVNGQLFAYSLNILGISNSQNIRPILQLIYVQDFEKLLTDAIRYQYLMSFKSTLENIDNHINYPNEVWPSDNRSKTKESNWNTFFNISLNFRLSTRLFNKYYNTPIIDRNDVNSMFESTDKSRANQYYREGNYNVAGKLFASIYGENAHLQALFYQGICEIELKNWEKAMSLFTELITLDSINMEYKWYYSLVAIKRKEWELAGLQLIDIVYSPHFRAPQAKEIYREITGQSKL
ncbi:tetratricopeptide repeat protein [Membranihabitans marinus]|uniref:tetratricopeptide repeat protein n=1 Tax=Membranihabitans marinus TaxID=1227546 RepID=UPI001F158BC3|nr:hypothetical protein [Membranihabitans marinus]